VNPGFRKADFERIKSQMISGIENDLRYSSDEELGKAALYEQVFEGTRYAHIEEGTVASLNAITLDDVKQFHKTFYTRDNVVIGFGGAYAKTLPDSFATALGALPAGKPETIAAPTPAKITGRHARLVEKDVPTTAISFGYPIDVKRGTKEFYALWIANSWLGEHRNSSSHLYQVIRETRGMNYGDYSYIEAFPNGGRRTMPPTGVGRRSQMFEVWIRPVAREQALFALRAALREVDTLATKGMTKEDFEATRTFLKKYALHFAETTADRLGYAIDDRFYGVDGHLAKFRKMMDEVTFEDVNAAVKKHLSAANLEISIVTKDATQLAEQMASNAPSPITYPAGIKKSDHILAEDKVIESFPLNSPGSNIQIVPVETMFEGTTEKTTG
jgi:zinc protease